MGDAGQGAVRVVQAPGQNDHPLAAATTKQRPGHHQIRGRIVTQADEVIPVGNIQRCVGRRTAPEPDSPGRVGNPQGVQLRSDGLVFLRQPFQCLCMEAAPPDLPLGIENHGLERHVSLVDDRDEVLLQQHRQVLRGDARLLTAADQALVRSQRGQPDDHRKHHTGSTGNPSKKGFFGQSGGRGIIVLANQRISRE